LPTKESLDDWAEYISIAIPATIMVCAEWWCFEVFVLISSYLGVAYLATNVIMQNIASLMFMVPLGF
jgi:MATE family multidrug resistance protein